jgi:hypothetical protein
MSIEFDENAEDVYGRTDPPFEAIPVHVTRSVRTKALPPAETGILSFDLTTTPIRILTADKRRGRATIIGFTQNLVLGTTYAQAAGSLGGTWPNLVPLIWYGTGEVWAASATSTASVSVIIDQWAD